ncbi:MAG TPA: hypothetical protein VGD80_37455 [Kofleriaceae bacterium]
MSFDDRKAWLISAERVKEVGPVRRIAAVDADHFLVIEATRATLRDANGAAGTVYDIPGITAFAATGDGARLAFGLAGGVIELVQARDARSLGLLSGHTGAVQRMTFSADGARLVSLALDRRVQIWDVSRSRELFHHVGIEGTPANVQFSEGGQRIAATSSESMMLLAAEDPSAELVIAIPEQVGASGFVANGTRIFTTSDTGVELWDARTGERLARVAAKVNNGAHADPAVRRVVIPRADVPEADVHELNGEALRLALRSSSTIDWAVFDHRGVRIATANAAGLIELWTTEGAKLATLRGHAATDVVDVEFSPDDRRLVSASTDRTARIWDVASGAEIGRVMHSDEVDAAVFDATGTRFATASADKSAVLWDVATGAPIRAFTHESAVRSVGLSPTLLAGATASGTVQLWDITTGREAGRFRHLSPVQSADLDGDRLLTTALDGRIVVWDVSTSVGSPEQVALFVCRIVKASEVTTRDMLRCSER